jgi:23S rRNA pseudouridine955/2504/2580 synthase
MFLHAAELELEHPTTGARLALSAPLPDDLQRFLDGLDGREHAAPV